MVKKESVMVPTPTPYKGKDFVKDVKTPVHTDNKGTWLLGFDEFNRPLKNMSAQRRTEIDAKEQKILATQMKKTYKGISTVYALPEDKLDSNLCQLTDEDYFNYVKKNGKLIDTADTVVKESIAPRNTARQAQTIMDELEEFLANLGGTATEFFDEEDLQSFAIVQDALQDFITFQDAE